MATVSIERPLFAPAVLSVRRKRKPARQRRGKASPATVADLNPSITPAFRITRPGYGGRHELCVFADSKQGVKAERKWQAKLDNNRATAIAVEKVNLHFSGTRFGTVWFDHFSRDYVPKHLLDFHIPVEDDHHSSGETRTDRGEAWDSLTREQALAECVKWNKVTFGEYQAAELADKGGYRSIDWLIAVEIGQDIEDGFLSYSVRGKTGFVNDYTPKPIRILQPTATELWRHGCGLEPAVKESLATTFGGKDAPPERFAVINKPSGEVVARGLRKEEAAAYAKQWAKNYGETYCVPEQVSWPTDAQVLAGIKRGAS